MSEPGDRREFLKKAGIGAVVLASAPGILGTLTQSARASGSQERPFRFAAFSAAGTIGGVAHRITMNGSGTVDPEEPEVEGEGTFVHFNNAPAAPKPILAFGRWEADELVNFITGFGTWGAIEAGIIEMTADLFPVGLPRVEGATLRIICNIGPAGITTGEPEGFKLTIPGAPFGPFNPLVPALGLTHIGVSGIED